MTGFEKSKNFMNKISSRRHAHFSTSDLIWFDFVENQATARKLSEHPQNKSEKIMPEIVS